MFGLRLYNNDFFCSGEMHQEFFSFNLTDSKPLALSIAGIFEFGMDSDHADSGTHP